MSRRESVSSCIQSLYVDNSVIFRARIPLKRMLFIIKGKLESVGDDGSVVALKEGDFCGEELLSYFIDWAGVNTSKYMPSANQRTYPLSSRTVRCLSCVEAFSLDSTAIEYIVTSYKAAFTSPRVQGRMKYLSLYWRTSAATKIQQAWRFFKESRKYRLEPSPSTSST